MVSTILSSTTSSFPSNSNPYSDASPTSTTFTKSRPPLELSRRPTLNFPKSLKLVPFRVFSSAGPIEDGSAEQFMQSNSIGDFMRFKTGADGGTGELQTAVVSYKKKFPWSLLKPFHQVLVKGFGGFWCWVFGSDYWVL